MAGEFAAGGAFGAHLKPAPTKSLWDGNYLNFADSTFKQWSQQFLPEVYEKEIERYGNRTVSGFLRMVGAEMPMASDQIIWSEQGRLHIAYDDVIVASTSTLTMKSGVNIPAHLIHEGMTIVIADSTGLVEKAYVKEVNGVTVTVQVYNSANGLMASTGTVKVFVYGSEYAKGSLTAGVSKDASFTTFTNKPIILRDKYSVTGSDTAQIGWVEVTSEAGTSGYLWYLKGEHESRLRFEDYLEMSMIEAELAQNTSAVDVGGSEGMSRGLVFNDQVFGTGGLTDFDTILEELDKQGAIEENMMFLDRKTSLGVDNMLAAQNSYGGGGTSYGVFNNSEDMALNLGFSGFRRGSYDFYKTDWKYLNDSTTRGLINDVEGVIVPAGTSTVYDQTLGKNIARPFLHVRYRASEADDRRMKSWVTGSVGGNYTSEEDAMNVHFLSERLLCVQGANNFVLLKKSVS
jgi:hypothetical protein